LACTGVWLVLVCGAMLWCVLLYVGVMVCLFVFLHCLE